jgi:hypothetical protein
MLKILSETKDGGEYKIKIAVKFNSKGKTYIHEYSSYPNLIDNFKLMLRKSEMKAYHYIKRMSYKMEDLKDEA